MKVLGVITAFILAVCLASTPVLAAPAAAGTSNDSKSQSQMIKPDPKVHDPIKALQARKEKVQEYLKEGKITQEKADAINAKIDSKIKSLEEFNKLTLPQKKDKLKSSFKTAAEKKVKDGKLTQDKASELMKVYNEKVDKWDGTGRPPFRGFGHKGGHHDVGKCQQ